MNDRSYGALTFLTAKRAGRVEASDGARAALGACAAPNFGPNVIIFDPSQSQSAMQRQINSIFSQQQNSQFGTGRFAIQRRLDLGLGDRLRRQQRLAATMDLAQCPVGELDRSQLEHGVPRDPEQPAGRVFARIGGAGVGKATVSLQINSSNVIVDHTWLWRADHGSAVGWTSNTAQNGLVVNGANVTVYGLFVEHFQQFQVLWNGNGGRTVFYQSEAPYDPPNQASWTSAPGVNGWASYKVADSVTSHEAWGMGIYAVFTNTNVFLTRAIEVPSTPNVKFHDLTTVNLNNGGISNVIDNAGGATAPGIVVNTPRVTSFP